MNPAITVSNSFTLTSSWMTYLKLILVALLWGGTFIAGRILAESLTPLQAATGRFGLALSILLWLAWKTEGGLPRLSLGQIGITFALGLTGVFIYNVCFFEALSAMPASRTAIFVAFTPVATAILLAILYREKITITRLLGIFIAVVGAIVVISKGDIAVIFQEISETFGQGELFMLCAVVGWAAYTVIGRQALLGLSPLASTTYASMWGLVLLLGAQIADPNAELLTSISWQPAVAVAYLALFGTVIPFVWYYQGVKVLGAARTAVFTNLVPVFGVFLGVVLLGEPFSLSMLLGGVLVILGVTFTNRTGA